MLRRVPAAIGSAIITYEVAVHYHRPLRVILGRKLLSPREASRTVIPTNLSQTGYKLTVALLIKAGASRSRPNGLPLRMYVHTVVLGRHPAIRLAQ